MRREESVRPILVASSYKYLLRSVSKSGNKNGRRARFWEDVTISDIDLQNLGTFSKCLQGVMQMYLWYYIVLKMIIFWTRGRQHYSVNDQIVNVLAFESHMFSIATTQFWCYCMKTNVNNTQMNNCGCTLIKLYLQIQAVWLNSVHKLYFAVSC